MSPTTRLNEIGITVLRFWNEQVVSDPENVLLRISEFRNFGISGLNTIKFLF